ncbi:MAG: RNA polymerase sigma-54 factor, partial [Alphaproteobacteria bacterium]|nr:RNA polymerase sigma-54 factor [Alphaproteobacteria bacterium]
AGEREQPAVSRVTTQKYMATPRGVFELKYFFTNGLGTGDGAQSAEAVKHRLKQLIDAENPRKVLSDDELAHALSAEGVPIARRTVAKYREALHIPTSTERKRLKRV